MFSCIHLKHIHQCLVVKYNNKLESYCPPPENSDTISFNHFTPTENIISGPAYTHINSLHLQLTYESDPCQRPGGI